MLLWPVTEHRTDMCRECAVPPPPLAPPSLPEEEEMGVWRVPLCATALMPAGRTQLRLLVLPGRWAAVCLPDEAEASAEVRHISAATCPLRDLLHAGDLPSLDANRHLRMAIPPGCVVVMRACPFGGVARLPGGPEVAETVQVLRWDIPPLMEAAVGINEWRHLE